MVFTCGPFTHSESNYDVKLAVKLDIIIDLIFFEQSIIHGVDSIVILGR